MATIQTATSGLRSDPSTWVGGIPPVEGDKVIVNAGHTVTIDGTCTWGDDNNTATLNTAAVTVHGQIKASRTVSSSLTIKGLLLVNTRTHGIDYGTDADPIPLGVTAELVLNKATTPSVRDGIRQFLPASFTNLDWSLQTFVGYNGRERGMPLQSTITAGSSTFTLTSASHGWEIGDEVLFFNTTNNSTVDECETRIIQSISGATITLTAPVTYTHLVNSPVANKTSNVIIRSYNEVSGQMANPSFAFPNTVSPATLGTRYIFKNVKWQNLGGTGANSGCINSFSSATSTSIHTIECEKNVIINNKTSASFVNVGPAQRMNINKCVFDINSGIVYGIGYVEINNSYIGLCTTSGGGSLTQAGTGGLTHTNNWITARRGNTTLLTNSNTTYSNCTISGCTTNITSAGVVGAVFNDCDLGYTYGWKALFNDNLQRLVGTAEGTGNTTLNRCFVNPVLSTPSTEASMALQGTPYFVSYFDRDNNLNNQEIYKASGILSRENSLYNRSTSSHKMKMLKVNADSFRDILIYATPGETITVVGYIRMDSTFYNAGDCFYPTATISGNSITPVVHTATSASNGAWEKFTLTATNGTANGGYFTLRLNARAKTTLGNVYFDGLPDYPFVSNCRHYGYTFDETNIKRTIDIYSAATESTASGYTGVSINGTTKRIVFSSGTADTYQKFYDYSRYWAVTNLDKAIPFARSGDTFIPATGWVFVDYPFSNTIQGGTVELTTTGTKTLSLSGSTIDFTTSGSYTLEGTYTGTIYLVNTSGGSVDVYLTASSQSMTYTNVGPNITVHPYVPMATAQVTNMIYPGSRLYIYNVSTNTDIYNDIITAPTWSLLYLDGTTFGNGDIVRVRLTYKNGTDASLGFEAFTQVTTAGWSVLADQVDDAVYIANAIDGATVTEISADYINLRAVITPGTTSPQRLYAWYVNELMSANGIKYLFGCVYAEDNVNYKIQKDKADIKLYNPTPASVVKIEGGRIYTSDNSALIDPLSNSIQLDPDKVYAVIVNTVSPVITGTITDVQTIVTNATNSIKGVDDVDNSQLLDGEKVINRNVKKASLIIPASEDIL